MFSEKKIISSSSSDLPGLQCDQEKRKMVDLNKFATCTTLHGAKHLSANYEAYTGFRGIKKRLHLLHLKNICTYISHTSTAASTNLEKGTCSLLVLLLEK